jgi:hypothetical protein
MYHHRYDIWWYRVLYKAVQAHQGTQGSNITSFNSLHIYMYTADAVVLFSFVVVVITKSLLYIRRWVLLGIICVMVRRKTPATENSQHSAPTIDIYNYIYNIYIRPRCYNMYYPLYIYHPTALLLRLIIYTSPSCSHWHHHVIYWSIISSYI